MTQELSQKALLLLFSSSLILGFVLGILYEPFRIGRLARAIPGKKKKLFSRISGHIVTGIEDIVFFSAAGVLTSVMFYALFQGRVRIMALVLELAGFVLYRVSVGRLVKGAADAVISFLRRVRRFIYQRIIKPPLRAVGRLFSRMFRAVKRAHGERVEKRISAKLIASLYKAAEKGFAGK